MLNIQTNNGDLWYLTRKVELVKKKLLLVTTKICERQNQLSTNQATEQNCPSLLQILRLYLKCINRASTTLKKTFEDLHSSAIQNYLEELLSIQYISQDIGQTDYSLWKATKIFRQPQKDFLYYFLPNRAGQEVKKCDLYAAHFGNVFT